MTRDEVNERYFNWMKDLVYESQTPKPYSYEKLLRYLHDIEYTWQMWEDGNRAEDGMDLRYKFAYDCSIKHPIVATYLDDRPCSVLEMLIALSFRCEETIMSNPSIGNRTGQWFWNMLVNLGLGSMTDKRFDQGYVDEVIGRFLNREYSPNGEGGIIFLENPPRDLRKVEIWCQMMWYLDEFE